MKLHTEKITHQHEVCMYNIHSIWPLSRPETKEQRQYIDNWYTGINIVQQAYTVCSIYKVTTFLLSFHVDREH